MYDEKTLSYHLPTVAYLGHHSWPNCVYDSTLFMAELYLLVKSESSLQCNINMIIDFFGYYSLPNSLLLFKTPFQRLLPLTSRKSLLSWPQLIALVPIHSLENWNEVPLASHLIPL
jgi:hypothetical protein